MNLQTIYTDWRPRMLSVLRIVAPLLFFEHGTQKLFGFPPTEHAPNSMSSALNGGDAAILFCFVFLYISFAGPGPWTLDAKRLSRQ